LRNTELIRNEPLRRALPATLSSCCGKLAST
jgi:hypothetical protein